MDCSLIEPELVGFHFGTLADEGRAAVEAHLVGCAPCLRAYLDTKRVIEHGEQGATAARPSEASRARLRAAAAAELAGRRRRLAAVSALAVAATVALVLAGVLARPAAPSPAVPAVDSARAVPASLDVL